MTDLRKRFSEAARMVSSKKDSIPQCVYGAYSEHLKNIDTDNLPENAKMIYGSIKDRLESKANPSDIGNVEAEFLAQDILCMAHVIDKTAKNEFTIIEPKDKTILKDLRPDRRRGPKDRRKLYTYVAEDRRCGVVDRRNLMRS